MSQENKAQHEVQESLGPACRASICNWNVIAHYLPKELCWTVYPSIGATAAIVVEEEETVKKRKITELIYWPSMSLKSNCSPKTMYVSLFPII